MSSAVRFFQQRSLGQLTNSLRFLQHFSLSLSLLCSALLFDAACHRLIRANTSSSSSSSSLSMSERAISLRLVVKTLAGQPNRRRRSRRDVTVQDSCWWLQHCSCPSVRPSVRTCVLRGLTLLTVRSKNRLTRPDLAQLAMVRSRSSSKLSAYQASE